MARKGSLRVKSPSHALLEIHLKELGCNYVREFRFLPDRRWRFDFALFTDRVAIEIEGGVWVRGRHTRGEGFINDLEKYNYATMLGWRVLRFTTQQILNGEAKEFLKSWRGGKE